PSPAPPPCVALPNFFPSTPERRKVITPGPPSGIARAPARRFAAESCDVCLNARREQRLNELLASIPQGDHLVCAGDYGDPSVIREMEQLLKVRWGRVDVLVNCAGVFQGADAMEAPLTEWRKPFDVMFEV